MKNENQKSGGYHNNDKIGSILPTVRIMKADDYAQVFALWGKIKGLGIRSIDDSEESIVRFIQRNPTTSFVAEANGSIVGSILCGHDGRRGCFYHVCVAEQYRHHGLATAMAERAIKALRAERINKVNLVAFKENRVGNSFWKKLGWRLGEDVNLYELNLNEENIMYFNE